MEQPKRILLIEDEFLVAEEMSEEIRDLGVEVIGPFASIDEAVEALQSRDDIDGALIDINLNGVCAYPVADELLARDVPFAFTTVYDHASIADRYGQIPYVNKPVAAHVLKQTIRTVLGLGATGRKAPTL